MFVTQQLPLVGSQLELFCRVWVRKPHTMVHEDNVDGYWQFELPVRYVNASRR